MRFKYIIKRLRINVFGLFDKFGGKFLRALEAVTGYY